MTPPCRRTGGLLQELPETRTPAVTPPAALEGLRWLPADSTLIAGVQVAERQTDAGRDLLNHLFHIGKSKSTPICWTAGPG